MVLPKSKWEEHNKDKELKIKVWFLAIMTNQLKQGCQYSIHKGWSGMVQSIIQSVFNPSKTKLRWVQLGLP